MMHILLRSVHAHFTHVANGNLRNAQLYYLHFNNPEIANKYNSADATAVQLEFQFQIHWWTLCPTSNRACLVLIIMSFQSTFYALRRQISYFVFCHHNYFDNPGSRCARCARTKTHSFRN